MVDVDDFLTPDHLVLGFPGSDKHRLFQDLATLASGATALSSGRHPA